MNETFIIAEAGANHNRDFAMAKRLIDVAAGSAANAVKFQTYSSETLYSKRTPNFAGYKNINKLIKDIELPRHWQRDLKLYCDDSGIEFMSTPFDELAVEQLVEIGVKRLKISGFESTDQRFVRMVASANLPVIISAGIGSNLDSIHNIVEWVTMEQKNPDITILHCNNAYPTPFCDINLNSIDKIREKFCDIKVGISDHTEGILAPCLAVAKGATCIEKHFTLSRDLPGPDHPFAIEPDELSEMIKNVRISEKMCSFSNNKITDSESGFSSAMRSVVAKRDIKKGESFTKNNITTMRPLLSDSLSADKFYEALSGKARREIEEGSLVLKEDIKW